MRKVREFLKNNLRILALGLIILLAAFLRFYRIADNPPSLNWDEVSHGYNAYSLIKTGKDEWGVRSPLIFRAYGDYKLPLYIYATAPIVGIFGLNALSVRLISILSGIGLVAVTYFLTRKITKSEPLSLLATFLTAVSPWSLFVSRVAVEANLTAFLFAWGIYSLLSWLENPPKKSLLPIFLCWGAALYTYNSARILVPLFVLITIFLALKKKLVRKLILPAAIFFIFLIPLMGQVFDRTAQARFELVSLLDQGAVGKIIEARKNSKLPSFVTRAIYNRPVYFGINAAKNYLANLSPRYLFFRGGSHYQFSQPDHELLYLVVAPFLLLGILFSLFKGDLPKRLLLFWFFSAFIPSAITQDAPHVLRTLLVLPAPMILTAIGLNWVLSLLGEGSLFKGRLLYLALIFSILVSFAKWWGDYWGIYPQAYSWAWQYSYKEAALFIKKNYQKYDQIFVTKRYGEPHEFLLFYLGWDPRAYQQEKGKVWEYRSEWYWINGFGKLVFNNDWEVKYLVKCESGKKCLLITSPNNYPKGWRKIGTISDLDGKPSLEILEQ